MKPQTKNVKLTEHQRELLVIIDEQTKVDWTTGIVERAVCLNRSTARCNALDDYIFLDRGTSGSAIRGLHKRGYLRHHGPSDPNWIPDPFLFIAPTEEGHIVAEQIREQWLKDRRAEKNRARRAREIADQDARDRLAEIDDWAVAPKLRPDGTEENS